MNADLEETLNELGPEYRAVVGRLRAGREVEPRLARGARRVLTGYLLAASLLVAVSLTIWFSSQPPQTSQTSQTFQTPQTSSRAPREYRMTPDEMIASQRADGSWANDFLTRRNADALKGIDDPRARIAYKKAMRNLRLRQAL